MGSQAAQDEFNALFHKNAYETGRSHPEDRSRSTSGQSSRGSTPDETSQTFFNDEDEADDLAVQAMRGTYYVPRATRQANTGPKGVIADAQAFEQAKRQAAQAARIGTPQMTFATSQSPPGAYKSEDSDKSSGDEDDDAFMAKWRQRRLIELTNKPFASWLGSKKKVYGQLTRVNAEGFLNAVDNAPGDTVVIVLIYDNSSEISNLVEDAVREMARKHIATRFIKLHYTEAEMEPAGVPALLAYRGGEKFAGFVPVSDEIPDHEDLSASSLTSLLQRHQVLA